MTLREIYENTQVAPRPDFSVTDELEKHFAEEEVKRKELQSEVDALSYGDIVGVKFTEGAGVGSVLNYAKNKIEGIGKVDENMDMNSLWEEYNVDTEIDEVNHHYLKDAINEHDFREKFEQMKRHSAVHRWEEDNPLKSFATDVLTLVPDAMAAGAMSKIWRNVSPASYVAANPTAAKRFLTGAGFELAFTAMMDVISPKDQKALDYIIAPLLVGSMHAGFGDMEALGDASRKAFARKLNLPELASKLDGVTDQDTRNKIASNHIQEIIGDNPDLKGASPEDQIDYLYDQDVKQRESKGLLNKLQINIAHAARTSKSSIWNRIGNSAWADRTLQGNRQGFWAAEEKGTFVEKTLIARTNTTMKDAEAQVGEIMGKNRLSIHFGALRNDLSMIIGNIAARRRFGKIDDDQAQKELEEQLKAYTGSTDEEAIGRAAQSMMKNIEGESFDSHRSLQVGGKKGFGEKDEIEATGSYFPTMYKPTTAQNFKDMGLTKKDHKEFLHRSLLSRMAKDAEEAGEELELSNEDHAIISAAAEELSDKIWKNTDNMVDPSKSYDTLLKTILDDPDFSGANLSPYTKKRTDFDYAFEHTFKNKEGKEVTLGFEDLVDTHYENAMNKYARKMGGATTRENVNITLKANEKDFDVAFKHYAAVRAATDERIESIQKEIADQQEILEAIESDDLLAVQRFFGSDLGAEDMVKKLDDYKEAVAKNEEELTRLKSMVEEAEQKVKPTIPGATNVKLRLDELFRLSKGGVKKGRGQLSRQASLVDEYPEFKEFIAKSWAENKKKDRSLKVGDLYEKVKKAVENQRKEGYFSDKHISGEVARGQELTEDMIDKADFDSLKHSSLREKLDLSTDENIAKIRQEIERELFDAGSSKRDVETELARFDDVLKEWKGMATSQTPDGRATQGMKISKNMNIFRLLGQTGFTMAHEGGAVLWRTGLKNFMEFSSFRALKNQLLGEKMDDILAQEIQTHIGLGGDLLDRIGGNVHDHLYNVSGQHGARKIDQGLNALENLSNKASEATLILGGIKPITSYLEMTMAKDSINNLTIAFARKGGLSNTDRKNLNEMGISDEDLDLIATNFDKHGKSEAKAWSKGHKVKELNFSKWDNEAQQALIFATRRLTNVIVQKSTLGDKVSWTGGNIPFVGQSGLFKNSLMGQVALELKDYMITAYTAQFLRNWRRKDLFTAGSLMTQMAAGATALTLKNYVNYSHDDEKLDESFETSKFMSTLFNQSTISSYTPIVTDLASDVLFDEPLFTDSRFHGPITSGLASSASLDLVNKGYNILKMGPEALHRLYEGEKAMSNKMLRDLLGTTLGNTVPAKAFINYMQDPYE